MKTNPKGFSNIIVIVLILGAVIIIGGGVFLVISQRSQTNQNSNTNAWNMNVTSNQNLNAVVNKNNNFNAPTGQNGNENTNTSQNQNINAPANTNATIDPTADWKTYRNEKYGFEVKYPSSFNLKERESSEFEKQNTEILFALDLRTIDEQKVVAVGVYDNFDGLPLDEWINKNTPNPNAYKEVVVDEQSGRKYSINAIGNQTMEYVIPFSNRIYFVNSLPTTSEFNLIFNSFRFIR